MCNRPFKTATQMNKAILRNHNRIVGPEDEVWNLGDITMKGPGYAHGIKFYVERFNGTLHLVVGNHDTWKIRNYLECGFETVHSAMWFEEAGWKFVLAHDPSVYTVVENNPKVIMLCGHVHNLFQHLLPEKRIINVGVDVWSHEPVSMECILNLLKEHDL